MSTANGLHHAIERVHRWAHRHRRPCPRPRNAGHVSRHGALNLDSISTALRDWHREMAEGRA